MTWSNWSGKQCSTPEQVYKPTTEPELVQAVADAAAAGLPLRAVGASHSHSRVAATDGVLVELDGWQGVVATDVDAMTASVRSGTRIFQLGEPLHQAGMALVNQGDIDKQSVAGATATGTHGTGPKLQNMSNAVQAIRLVLASGELVDCTPETTPELFQVARHSLGAVGLVTEVTLGLRPSYRLHETMWIEGPEPIFERIDELVAATRHFEFFWMPDGDFCAAKTLAETELTELEGVKHQRVGWSHEIISSIRDDLHTEMEYAVPAKHGPACFLELRAMIQQDFADLTWPLEYRTLRSDDLWISAATGRETVTISVHQDIALDDAPLFAAAEAVFKRYDGRPHWGKAHNRSGAELADMYPKYAEWWRVRDAHDPDGLFVTPYLASLRP